MVWVARILFFLVFAGGAVAMQVYLYRRLVRDLTPNRSLRGLALGAMIALSLGVPLGRVSLNFGPVPPWVSAALMSWWGLSMYLVLALLLLELVGRLALRPPARSLAAALGAKPDLALSAAGGPAAPSPERASEPPAPSIVVEHLAPAPAFSGRGGGPFEDRPEALKEPAPRPEPQEPPERASRRVFLSRATAAGALALGGGLGSLGLYRAFEAPAISEVPVRLPGLPKALDGFTIVQLSDLHVGSVIQERFLDQLVRVANAAKPDLVAITGDLVDGSPAQLGAYVARLTRLSSRLGTYFVSGNHDYYSGWERWAHALDGLGFKLLRNERVEIGDAGGSFDLIGVEDWGTRVHAGGYDLEAATAGRDPARASVLLQHQPVNVEAVTAKSIGLMLSGHTHGGQLFPGPVIARAIYGDRVEGRSKVGATTFYTSRGCGFVGPPMRLGAPPEVVKLVLTS